MNALILTIALCGQCPIDGSCNTDQAESNSAYRRPVARIAIKAAAFPLKLVAHHGQRARARRIARRER
jgi:hypothetical protein